MAELTQFEQINGIFIVIIVILLWYIGLKLFLKYRSIREKKLLMLGMVFIFQGLTWFAPAVVFLSLLLTGNLISLELYLLIGHAFNLGAFFWIYLLTELMFKNKQKIIISILGIYLVATILIFFYLFFTNISLIASFSGFLRFQQGPFLVIRNLSFMIISIIFTIIFYRESHKSENPEVRLRGTLFLAALILIILGGISHMITGLVYVVLIFFLIAGIFYYTALLTPEWMKKRLIKKEE